MENLTGKELNQYRVLGPLGEGGMAAVYRAYQASMDREVAIKILPRLYAAEPGFLARFEQEARVIAKLEHPHIIPVHDFGEAEGYTYLVMRFVEGGTLADMLGRGPLPLEEIQRIIRQISGALDYAHNRGVIHRDVKPTNVLIDPQGNCLLTDFGIAKMVEGTSALTVSGAFLGTPKYASPEQARGEKLTGHSDVYSLGVILYEMATGRPPFEAETPMALIFKHANDPLPLPSSINPAIPPPLEKVILKALAKAKEDRYATAGELSAALDQIQVITQISPSAPAPATAKQTISRVPRPIPWRLIVGGALGLVVVIGGAFGIANLLPSAEPSPEPIPPSRTAASATELPTDTPSSALTPFSRQPDTVEPISVAKVAHLAEALLLTGGTADTVEFNPNGDLLAVGGGMGTWIYEVETMEALHLLNPGSVVVDISWSPDGSLLASASQDGAADIWDVRSADLTLSLFGHEASLASVAWSPDGSMVATSAFDGTIRIWDPANGEARRVIDDISSGTLAIAWSPKSDGIGAGSQDGTIRIYDPLAGSMLLLLGRHDGAVEALAVSPEGGLVASGGRDGRVRVWDVERTSVAADLDAYGFEVVDVAWSPDGTRLAESSGLGSLGHVGVFDWEGGEKLSALDEVFLDYTLAMDWSDDGTRIAAATLRGDLVVWDGVTGQLLHELRLHGHDATGLSWSPDGARLASTTSEGIVHIWDAEDGTEITWAFIDAPAQGVDWSPDGSRLIVPGTDGIAYLLEAADLSILDEFRSGEEFAYSTAWSWDGTLVALAAETGSLTIWDTFSGGRLAALEGHAGFVEHVAWEPRGERLASVGNDRTMRVWNTDIDAEVYRVDLGSSQSRVAWSADGGRIATGGLEGVVHVFDAADGTELRALEVVDSVSSLAWSPDGILLAVGTERGDLIVFEENSSTELARFAAHNNRITGLEFSPDGSELATAGIDGGVIVWGIP